MKKSQKSGMEKKQSQRARKIFGTFAKNWKNRKNPGRRKDKKKQVRNVETCFVFMEEKMIIIIISILFGAKRRNFF